MDIKKVYKEVSSIQAMINIAIEHGKLDGPISDSLKFTVNELQMYLYDMLSNEYYN